MDLKQAILDLLKSISGACDYTWNIEVKVTGTFYSLKLKKEFGESPMFFLEDCNSDEEFLEIIKKELDYTKLHSIDFYEITKITDTNCNK